MPQSRRDQLQAYRFLTRRAQSALVIGEPDALEAPMRRLTSLTMAGIFVAILLVAGFGLKGLISGSDNSKDVTENGTVIIEQETGARYVVINGVLHPALNFTSAVLAAGNQNGAKIVTASRSSLDKKRRGATIGVPGLPDSIPAANNLVHSPLTSCSRLTRAGVDGVQTRTEIDLGSQPAAAKIAATTGVVVTTPSNRRYLLWAGRRYAITDPAVAAQLRLDSVQGLVVGDAFVNTVPAGAALAAPQLAGAGTAVTFQVAGQSVAVGQLLHVQDDNSSRVVLSDGIAVVTPVQAVLLARLAVGTVVNVSAQQIATVPQSQKWTSDPIASEVGDLPDTVPTLDQSAVRRGAVCAVYARTSDQTPTFTVPTGSAVTGFGQVSQSADSQNGVADSIVLPPGAAAVVKSSRAATVFLVADPGRKFAFVSSAALGALGYGNVVPDVVPDFLLATLPTGPALDPATARRTSS